MKIKHVSIIVPAYKQEALIESNLKKIVKVLEKTGYKYELICVVDGIKVDKTYQKALNFSKNKKKIKIIGYNENQGKGYAIRFGMTKSKGDIIGYIDAGGDIKPSSIPKFIEYFNKFKVDIVVGSKRHPSSKIQSPWQRKIYSNTYQIFIKILFNLEIKDTQVGLKFYRREVLEKILSKLNINRFAFEIEMISVAQAFGFSKIYEAPIEVKLEMKGSSNITNQKFIKTVLQMIFDTILVFYRLKISNYYSNSKILNNLNK